MVSAYRSSVVARRGGAYRPLTALQSPYCQRRLLRTSPCRMPIALPRESVIAKAPALSQGTTAVSCWLAPYGASSVPCSGIRPVVPKGHCLRGNRRRRVVREGTPPFTFGSRSVPWKPYPAPRFTAAASCISAASRASALSRLASATPRTGLAPTHRSSGAAPKAAQPAQLKRWAPSAMNPFSNAVAIGNAVALAHAAAPASAALNRHALPVRREPARGSCTRCCLSARGSRKNTLFSVRSGSESAVVLAPVLALAGAFVLASQGAVVSSSGRRSPRGCRAALLTPNAVSRRLTFARALGTVPSRSSSPNPAVERDAPQAGFARSLRAPHLAR